MATIECEGEKFMYAPDVQGPMSTHTFELIIKEKPQVLMIGGPPLYLAGFKVGREQIRIGMRNLEKIVGNIPIVILEHHILRDESWFEKSKAIFERASRENHKVLTAAEYLGEENLLLEALRKKNFEDNPPSKEFERWMQKSVKEKRHLPPPI